MPDNTKQPSKGLVVRIQADNFDTGQMIAQATKDASNIGAVVSFTGLCRDEGGKLAALELEHYAGMAQVEITRIAERAYSHWPLDQLTVIHRYGKIAPGENIVLVIATSSHRQAAFEAASYLMDYLKTHAPFWKKEHLIDGTSSDWVDATEKDDKALERWKDVTRE